MEIIKKQEAIMKRIFGAKKLLVKAKTEAKRQDKRRIKKQVMRQARSLAKISGASKAQSPETTTPVSSN
jgi:hypothetical protein